MEQIFTTIITSAITSTAFILYVTTIQRRVEEVEKEVSEMKYNFTDRFEDMKDTIHKLEIKIIEEINKIVK